ncbi:DUF4129 domain-containing protein [Longitalea luteola]|uniref:DUF4129 domain-containing protein n=1 Tax=Longitalea luteola TaxID=2812563 RepID=UPI001A96C080|nr:DUF4129 domain-containing protein [Longitalea luteola]
MNYFASYRFFIPTVKSIQLIACLAVLLALSAGARAQENDTAAAIVEEALIEETTAAPDAEDTYKLPEPPQLRQVPDSIVNNLKKQEEFAYANDPAYWERDPELPREPRKRNKGFWDHFFNFFSGSTVRTITYGILIAFFLFVIYRIIVVNKLFLFYSSGKTKAVAGGDDMDIEDENLDEKIRKAIAAKEHRPAVRFMYLKVLQLLNERQWIRYHADGTNYEYVIQMSGHKLGNEFSSLTRVYDYVWYGEFTLTEEQFDIVHKNFSHFYNAIYS